MIYLDKSHIIGVGEKRSCYRHPEEEALCIKVVHKKDKRVHRNITRELKYLQKYSAKIRLPQYIGEVETNLGKGYIFERISDWNGKSSITLIEYRKNNGNMECIKDLLEEMYHSFLYHKIIISDFHAGNVLINYKNLDDSPSLILIDGIGNSDFIKICDRSKFFLKLKLIRKFKRLMRELGIAEYSIK